MTNIQVELPKTFKLSLFPKILYLAISIVSFGFILYVWIFGSFLNPIYFAIPVVFLAYVIWWIPTVKLELTHKGVSYQRGMKTNALNWEDIKAISHRFHYWGSGSDLDLFLISRNPCKKDVKINELHFTKENFLELIAVLEAKGDKIEIDPNFINFLSKKGWTGAKF